MVCARCRLVKGGATSTSTLSRSAWASFIPFKRSSASSRERFIFQFPAIRGFLVFMILQLFTDVTRQVHEPVGVAELVVIPREHLH